MTLEETVPVECAGLRLDQVLSQVFPEYSRSRLTEWIKEGRALVNGKQCRPKDRLVGGEQLVLEPVIIEQTDSLPQDIALDIVFEDEHILVLNKPAGMVVHPAAGNHDGTLMNGLLYHYPEQNLLPRAGIVHRLDKDTTGLMVVARTEKARLSLVEQLQTRDMGREYAAVVSGQMTGGGVVDQPIGRHPQHRTKMAVHPMGKEAITHYWVEERFQSHTLIKVKLETGRTHQIRVHMAYLHYPLVGDRVYAGRQRVPAGATDVLREALKTFTRQALHARTLTLIHPHTNKEQSWEAAIPDDMSQLISVMRSDDRID